MLDSSINTFLDELGSKAPVPGGGSTSALVGALAAALGRMSGALTVGKKKYADVENDLRDMMDRAQELREKLCACVQKDIDAFEPLSKAYAIPKDDPNRDGIMEKCLKTAASAPLEILDLCCEATVLNKEFSEKAGRLVISDAATGAALCWAALHGAALNVKVNTSAMKDRAYAGSVEQHVDEALEKYSGMAEETFYSVYGRYS
ncbi:MAG: cyclodeaminase/cyclohydrolase family protein [Clostridiales bacterium]|nr:cyclodeaminase/cyclohydrolase family protein [Clostridiales bacterium]